MNRIELSSGLHYAEDLLPMVRRAKESGLRFLIHNYFPPPRNPFVLNLASDDSEVLRKSLEHCFDAIDLCAELTAPFYSVHSGFGINLTPELLGNPEAQEKLFQSPSDMYEKTYAIFLDSIAEVNEYAKEKGIQLLIENNVVSPLIKNKALRNLFLMARAEEIIRLMHDMNDPNLGVLVDLGHANVSARAFGFDRYKFIDLVAPFIKAFHLSDNDGVKDQNLAFDENSWFISLLRLFPTAFFIIEAYRLELSQMKACVNVIEQAILTESYVPPN